MLATGVAVFADQEAYVEGETAWFTFQLSQPAPQPFAVEYEITGGPAGPQSVVLHFSQGTTSATVPVETADNATADDGYALNVVVRTSTEAAPPGAGGTFGAATTDILDDDTGDGSGGALSADDNDDFFTSSFGSSSGGGGGGPQSVMLDAPSGEASEGIPFQLTGTISPPGYYSFSYTIDYNYGNFNYNPGTGAFSVYVLIPDDEPSGPPELPEFDDVIKLTMNVYAIGQQNPAASHYVDVKVNNMAPTFTHPEYGGLLLIDIYDYPLGGPYFVVNGNIHDYGTQDQHTVTIDWGDGTPLETFPLQGSIFSTHRYVPDGGDYPITVTVTDDDGGIGSIQGLAPMYLLDLDNDADNNGDIDEDDDPIEHVPPGAYIGVNGDDDDEDGIPDMSPLQSLPVENENDLEPLLVAWEPTVRIYENEVLDYTGWHVVLTLDPPPVWDSYEEEVISVARLYTASDKSGYVPFVETGPYDMLALAWPAEDAFSTTFYVEALSAGQFRFQLELREPGWGAIDQDLVVFTTRPMVGFEKRTIVISDGGRTLPVKVKLTEPWDGDDSGAFRTTDLTATSVDVEYPVPDYQSKQLAMPFELDNPEKPGIFAPGATERIIDVNINDESYDEVSQRFKMNLYDLSPELIPGITEAFVTIVGIDLRTDINNDDTIDPAPIYPPDMGSDDPLGFMNEELDGSKGIFVDGSTPVKVELGDIQDLGGYRVIFEKSAGSVLLTASQSSAEDISGQPFTIGSDDIPEHIWVKGLTPGAVLVWGIVVPPEGVEDPEFQADPDAGGPIGLCYDGDKVRITVIELEKVKDVDFSANHHLVSDPTESGSFTDYTALSEWHDENVNGSIADAGDRRYPVAYKRGVEFSTTATIKAQLFDFGKYDWDDTQRIIVRVTSSHNSIEVTSDVQGPDIGASSFSVTVTAEFHDMIDFMESFDLWWEVSIDKGNTWVSVGTTTHPVYLTFDNPDIDPIYHTVMHLGSAYGQNATDHNSAPSVVAAIWDSFSDRTVKRVAMSADWQVIEVVQLVYWGAWALQHAQDGSGYTTSELLAYADGKCGAWTSLLRDVLAAQGIAAEQKEVHPKPVPFAIETIGIRIKNWTFDEEFRVDAPNYGPIYLEPGVAEADGIPGQGNPNPHSLFNAHSLVQYSGLLYDPSYGGDPYADLLAWEAVSLGGVTFTALVRGQTTVFVSKQQAGRQDTEFQ